MRRLIRALAAMMIGGLVSLAPKLALAQDAAPSFAAAVDGLTRSEGFIELFADADGGRVLAALPAPDAETRISLRAIHIAYLRTGLGSNPVGLDRGRNGGPRVVRFEIRGGRAYLIAENTQFTAQSDNPAERRAVEESFARSVLWAADSVATAEDGRVLVDVSSLLTSDVLGIAAWLDRAGQGSFSLDAGRSAADPSATLAFPDNVELEGFLTFASSNPGDEVDATAAVGEAVTFTIHHSFVRLPEDGFERRAFDPRIAVINFATTDYAAPLDAPLARSDTLRFRLERVDPTAESSPAVEPIVFYVDPGVPEPVRSALVEGASWWAEAFEAAGYEDAFRVEILPEDAHPLDARYNIIQWVHRQTRGWSYGSPIYDPRTGEIIRAVITLGSLRVRQDRRIFEGLLDARRTGSGAADDPVILSLARLRQLSAHEVGHGLGFPHNMAASASNRASVMDYPAPLVRLDDDGAIDVSEAYAVGIGAWDIATTRFLYSDFPDGADVDAELDAIIEDARADGLLFVTDGDSRPTGGAHPAGSLWDNGSDPVAELETALAVRRTALSDFGLDSIADGAPASELRQTLTPIHLWHRYAVDAAAKLVGGYDFTYETASSANEDSRPTPVDPSRQRAALAVLLRAIDVEEISLNDDVVALMAPAHASWFDSSNRELIRGATGSLFDPRAASAAAAGLVFDALLAPARLARLDAAHARNALSLEEMLAETSAAVLSGLDAPAGRLRDNGRAILARYVSGLIAAASDERLPPATAARIELHLRAFATSLRERTDDGADPVMITAQRLERFLDRPFEPVAARTPPAAPPGSPIGNALIQFETEWHAPIIPLTE